MSTDFCTPLNTFFRTGERPVSEADAVGDAVARKAALRDSFLKRRRRMQLTEVLAVSERICKRLLALPEFVSCENVALYQSFDQEVNLKKVIAECGQQGKKVLLPRFNPTVGEYEMVEVENLDGDTVPGCFGIEEPRPELPAREGASLQRPDIVWLVPGVAFDSAGHRLGRGAGYFDRILTGVTGIKIGVAYDWQIVPELPSQLHDQSMNIVVSEKRVVRVSQPAG